MSVVCINPSRDGVNFRLPRSLHQNLLIDDHVHSLRRINAAPSKLSAASTPVKPGSDESSSETVSLDLVGSSGKASSASRRYPLSLAIAVPSHQYPDLRSRVGMSRLHIRYLRRRLVCIVASSVIVCIHGFGRVKWESIVCI